MSRHEDRKLARNGVALTAVVVASALLAGCYAPRPHVVRTTVVEEPGGGMAVVTVAPPPPRMEIVPAAPGRQFVWDPGHWRWNGASYVWIAGHYVARPRTEAVWIAGHWTTRGGGWVWEEGHWG